MTGEALVAIIGGSFALLAALLAFLGTRGKTKNDAKSALDARIDARVEKQLETAWTEIDELKATSSAQTIEIAKQAKEIEELKASDRRKMTAVGRILRAIAAQWPSSTAPDLDPADIAEIEDTIPAQWIRKKPRFTEPRETKE